MGIPLRTLLAVPIAVLIGAIIWIFILKNEPFIDGISRNIEESTTWSTEMKMQNPSLFLYSVSQKLKEAIENQQTATYELQKSGDLLNSKLKANLSRTQWIDKKLRSAKGEYITLERNFELNPDNYSIQIDIAEKKNEITTLLLEKEAIANTILRTKKQIDLNMDNIQVAGIKTIQLETDLGLVESTDDLAKVLNPGNGSGLSSIGSSEIQDLLADVGTLQRYLQGQTDEYISSEYKIIDFDDGSRIFDEFMGSDDKTKEEDLDNINSTNVNSESNLEFNTQG
tara:strand:+ start:104 stop:952 length:849 start_codon:yes stop_codon:yes gene_type:complete